MTPEELKEALKAQAETCGRLAAQLKEQRPEQDWLQWVQQVAYHTYMVRRNRLD